MAVGFDEVHGAGDAGCVGWGVVVEGVGGCGEGVGVEGGGHGVSTGDEVFL